MMQKSSMRVDSQLTTSYTSYVHVVGIYIPFDLPIRTSVLCIIIMDVPSVLSGLQE